MLAPDEKELRRTKFAQGVASAQAELKANPARSDKALSLLVGISKASVYRVRSELEATKAIPVIPHTQRERVKGQPPRQNKIPEESGPRIGMIDGVTLVELIHAGIKLEEDGKTAEDAAYLIGIGRASYRQARSIVQLAERTDLTTAEKELTQRALSIMIKQRRTADAHALIKDLVRRVWGNGKSPHNEKTTQFIIEKFMNAISVITIACDKGEELEVPQLSANDAAAVILQLRDAALALKKLRSNLNRRIR